MKSKTALRPPLVASITLAIAQTTGVALGESSELIGDWQRKNVDGSRVLVKLQPNNFGIRYHFSADGPLQYSVVFEWLDTDGGYVAIERKNDGSIVSRDLDVRECDGRRCIAFDGLGAPFVRIAPE